MKTKAQRIRPTAIKIERGSNYKKSCECVESK